MSNPLAMFRKYQKTMLAFAAVGAMLAFGILPIMSDFMGQSAGRGGAPVNDGNAVAVSWQGGQLREGELQNLQILRSQLRSFQQGVVSTAVERGGRPLAVVIPNTSSEASIVESLLLAEEAKRMGIHVGEDAVLQHLTQHLANDTIDRNEMAAILRDTTNGLGQEKLFEGLKIELAAHQVRILANGAAYDGGITDTAVTPGQSFEYFRRMYRRMEAEVMAVPVEDFLDQVAESPTEAEIVELYDEYKETFPSPVTPTPGFKEPMKAAFQWVKADFTTFLEREIANLTDEEIQKYYDDNKSSYKKIELPDFDNTSDSSEPDVDFSGDEAVEEEVTDTDSASSTEEEAAVPPSERFQEDGESAGTEDAAIDTDGVQAEVDAAEDEVVIADLEDGTDEAVVAELTEQTEETGADSTADSGETSGADDATTEATEEVEYQPLEDVRDEIARTLARPKASDAIKKAVDEVIGELKTYFDDYMYWDTSPEEEKGAQPTPPDLKALAERLGMVSGDIPLITVFEASEYELGRAFELDFSSGQIQRLPFTSMGFSPSLALFNPKRISASDVDSQFVFWKTEQRDAFTPTLDEARDSVVRHWKMKKALELAKAEGEKLAKKVRDETQSLRTAYGGDATKEITDTGQFTWMTFGATPQGQGAPRISFVEGVEYPGEEFMKAVSKLETGDVTVTQNYPETTVYVVYMKGVTGNQEDLRTLFLNEGLKQPVLFMARQDNMRTASEWYLGMEKDWALKWARPPGVQR